jgi:acetyl-CoA carboxylase biotin carboxyl carrier protein
MDIKQIQELVAQMDALKLRKLVYKKGDLEIHLEKEDTGAPVVRHVAVSHEAPEHKKVTGRVEEVSGVFVTSPMVGTFYAAPAPDQAHFVKVGDRVHEKTIVCIVEAMKVMNEVKAGVSGTIVEALVQSGHPVEFGTRLFRVQP